MPTGVRRVIHLTICSLSSTETDTVTSWRACQQWISKRQAAAADGQRIRVRPDFRPGLARSGNLRGAERMGAEVLIENAKMSG